MRLIISPLAEKQLRKLNKVNQIIVAKKIRSLKTNEKITSTQLRGYKNIYRIRIGNMRVVFKKTVSEVYIILIGHRRDIYEKLKTLLK